ncbi:hypothetical protein ZIOFF_076218 [Zingiber officinale]|uniref:Uncharacterized protein n=1 Tax=Zingiber officinale TaxID=94328 RepID=A0A8J5C3Y0_ZINOF|nr:hypothetical protein ZIOFF_076218 [Zingiber officinale]
MSGAYSLAIRTSSSSSSTFGRRRSKPDPEKGPAAGDGSRSPPSLAMALAPPVVATLCPSFFASPSANPRLTFPPNPPAIRHRPPASYPRVRALDLDQDTLVAISVGVVSVAVGIGIPVFYESQIDSAAKRENSQPCFPCNGSGARKY